MQQHPIDIALKEVSETRRLLRELIRSSETFDYVKAKEALQLLDRKVRDLARIQASLRVQQPTTPSIVRPIGFVESAPRPSQP